MRYRYGVGERGYLSRHVTPLSRVTCGQQPHSPLKTSGAGYFEALLGETVLLIVCKEREYRFAMPDDATCERWAKNIVQLALFASCEVKGYIVPEGGVEAVANNSLQEHPQRSSIGDGPRTPQRDELAAGASRTVGQRRHVILRAPTATRRDRVPLGI